MKKVIFLLILLPHLVFAGEEVILHEAVRLISSATDSTLQNNEALYEFQFQSNFGTIQDAPLIYSIDGVNGSQVLINKTITIRSTAGKHIFQFYYNDHFHEVYTDSLHIHALHRDQYMVTFTYSVVIETSAKPVIYFYPKKSTAVQVKMNIHGEDQFYYPSYLDSWNFIAHANGDLVFGKNTYNYLFWEATTRILLTPKQTARGFFVEGKNAVQFLEEKLTLAGLNSKEQADFITFWGPRMVRNELNFIHFDFNEECDAYATIDISPKPDNVYRIYMLWGSVSERFNVKEQEISRMDRTGFSVLEWGGQESFIKQSFVNKTQKTKL